MSLFLACVSILASTFFFIRFFGAEGFILGSLSAVLFLKVTVLKVLLRLSWLVFLIKLPLKLS